MICHRPFVHVHAPVCACGAMRVRHSASRVQGCCCAHVDRPLYSLQAPPPAVTVTCRQGEIMYDALVMAEPGERTLPVSGLERLTRAMAPPGGRSALPEISAPRPAAE
jgi:hypothetical protein